jgi:hypothetical protein
MKELDETTAPHPHRVAVVSGSNVLSLLHALTVIHAQEPPPVVVPTLAAHLAYVEPPERPERKDRAWRRKRK